MTALLPVGSFMSNNQLRPPQQPISDDTMEIASDPAQHADNDIEIDFDGAEASEYQDQNMDDDDGEDLIRDDEMSDEDTFKNDTLDVPDEELSDATDEQAEQDIDVTDVPEDEDTPNLDPSTVPAINDNGPTDTTERPNTNSKIPPLTTDQSHTRNSSSGTAQPTLLPQERGSTPTPRNAQDEQLATDTEHTAGYDEEQTNNPEHLTDGDQGEDGVQEVSTEGLNATASVHDPPQPDVEPYVPPTPPLAMSKEELLGFPMVLRFAGTDNNLFPLPDSDGRGSGYLLDDRILMKKPIRSIFDTLRAKFAQAIPEDSLLGLEFPGLNLKLNEESPFSAEAGCCLLSFVDLYAKLSSNDGNHDPPPFAMDLHVEDRFYSRFQYLRNALNEGRGLSEVVHPVHFHESFEEYGEEYDEAHGGEVSLEPEPDNKTQEHFEEEEHVEHGDVKEVEEPNETDTYDDALPHYQESQADHVAQQGEAAAFDDEYADDSWAAGGEIGFNIDAKGVQSEFNDKAPAQQEQLEQDAGGNIHGQARRTLSDSDHEATLQRDADPVPSLVATHVEHVDESNNGSCFGPLTPTFTSIDEGELDIDWFHDANAAEDQVQPTSSSGLTVNDSARAHEDEESLIDYSDEEAGQNDPTQHEETEQSVAATSSPGNDRKRRLERTDDNVASNGAPPNKAPKLQRSAQTGPAQSEATDDAADGEDDLIIDYGDDKERRERDAAQTGNLSKGVRTSSASLHDAHRNGNSTTKKAAATAPIADDEEDLINYGSDSEDGDIAETNDANELAGTSVSAPALEEHDEEDEDLIDYSEDDEETATTSTVKAS